MEVEYIFMSRVSLLKRAFFTDAGSWKKNYCGGCFVSDGWQRYIQNRTCKFSEKIQKHDTLINLRKGLMERKNISGFC